jgi:ubiquinone biosynthesis O-methyltransferase
MAAPLRRLVRSAATTPLRAAIPHSSDLTPRIITPIAAQSRHHSSVSPEEVAHFNALASEWWEPHGSSRILHLMNPLRHDFIHKCQNTYGGPPAHQLRYLDIGCGGGIFAESAARLPTTKSVTAIDPTEGVLNIAKAHAKRDPALASKLTYLNTSVEGLESKEPYDIVSVLEVIEHVNAPSTFLDAVTPHIRPGGWLIMSTIARTWVSWFTTNFMAEDVLGIVPKGTHDWNKYVNCEELEGYFAGRGGWSKPVVQGVVYVPGVGWKEVNGSEKLGNYFIGVRREPVE